MKLKRRAKTIEGTELKEKIVKEGAIVVLGDT